MSKSNLLENSLLKLLFQAVPIAGLADDDATSPVTDLYVSLHTADPGEAGSQTTSEAAYTGYARVAVPRSAVGWTVTSNSVSPAAPITFGADTVGTGTATHFGVGTAASGVGELLYSGTVTPNIAYAPGVTPELTTATAITED